jgi:hypothetical protein
MTGWVDDHFHGCFQFSFASDKAEFHPLENKVIML